MIFNSLKSRIIISITTIVILSLLITVSFIEHRAKEALSITIEGNALNLLEVTKNQVESQHNSILYHKSVMLSRRKIELKSSTTIAFTVVHSAYQQYLDGQLSESEAKNLAMTNLQNMRYDEGVGYFWINDIGRPYPTMLMHPTTPSLVGNVMDDPKYNCALGEDKSLFIAFVDVCLKNGEGYVDYLWPKPTPEGLTKEQPKISFVRLFEPWDWIIGTGVYIDDIDKDVQDRIDAVIEDLNRTITKQRSDESGYFFIFNEDNYLLVHPILASTDGNQLKNPTTGNSILNELKNAVSGPKNSMEYLWDKPGFEGEYRFPKKAYIAYYEPLGWYIGSTVYKEDYQQKISNLTSKIILFSFSFIIITIIVSLFVSRSVTKPLNQLIASISYTDADGVPSDVIPESGTKELQLLGSTINNMIKSISQSRIELKEQHQYSQNIIDGAPYIICGISPDGITTYINPPGETKTGFSQDEIIGKNWWDIFYPGEESKQVEELFGKFEDGNVIDYEMRLTCKDGSKRDIVWNSLTIRDSENNIETIFGFGNDITDRKKAEEALDESQIRYESLFDSASDTILLLKDGKFVECNQNALEMYGADRDDLIGYSPIQFSPEFQPDGKKSSEKALEKIRLTLEGNPQIFDWQHIKPDGTLFDAEISLKYIELTSGPHVMAIVRDVTEKNRAKESLRKSQELLDLAMSVTNDGIWDWHIEEDVVFLDDRYYTIAGYEPGEFPGDHKEWENRIHHEDRERVDKAIEDYLSGKINKYDIEFKFKKKDGNYMWLRARGKIVTSDAEGSSTRFVGTHSDVTERKEAERALKESEELLNLAMSVTNDGIWDWYIDKDIVFFDERYYTMAGYKNREFPSTFDEWEKRIHPEDLDRCKNTIEKYLTGELDNYEIEFRFLHKNNSYMWLQTRGEIVSRDKLGKPARFMGTHVDITERKKAEHALKSSEDRYRAIFENTGTASLIVDEKHTIQLVNDEFVNMTGYTKEEIEGKRRWTEFVLEDDLKKMKKQHIMRRLDPSKALRSYEFRLRNRSGQVRDIFNSVVVIPDTKLSVSALLDITDRKRQEVELQQLRNYLSNIIDSMPSILIGVNPDGIVTEWNQEASRETGISAKNAIGKHLDKAIPRLAQEMERVKEAMRRREVIVNPRRTRQEDDEILYENITVYPLTANGVEGAVIRVDDVTDNVRLEEMMIQSEKMLSVGGLAAGMAHEINNPLAGMMQTASVMANRLSKRIDLPANIKAAEEAGTSIEAIKEFMEARDIPQMISTINESGRRVADIVNNMLSFARKSEASVTYHNIIELIESTLILATTDYDLKKHFDFKTINIIKEYDDNLPLIPCESAKIQQVLLNLLRNGSEAMQETGTKKPTFVIRAKMDQAESSIRIEVEDNGPGMDEKTRKRVFEPFFTTKPVGVGTGLGLSVSYFIITENHGGKMRVVSNPDSGANFIIRLPLKN